MAISSPRSTTSRAETGLLSSVGDVASRESIADISLITCIAVICIGIYDGVLSTGLLMGQSNDIAEYIYNSLINTERWRLHDVKRIRRYRGCGIIGELGSSLSRFR